MEESISTAIATVPESSPASTPTWGLDGGSVVEYAPAETPSTGSALTTDKMGSTLDSSGNISDDLVARIAANMKTAEPSLPKELKGKGTVEEIAEAMDLVNGIYEPTGKGIVNALDAVFERDQSAFDRIGFTVVASAPALAVRHLITLGYLPETIEQPQPREIPQELKALIPESLVSTAERVPSVVLYDWVNMGILLSQLEQKQKLDETLGEVRAKADEDMERGIAQAKETGAKALAELHDQYVTAHYEQLNKWNPTGDKDADSALRDMVFSSGLNEILSDQKWANIQAAIAIQLQDAPLWRVVGGDHMKADTYERDGRALAYRFNVRLGQIMKAKIAAITPFLKQAQQAEPPALPDPEPPKLIDGQINDDWAAWVYRQQQKEK